MRRVVLMSIVCVLASACTAVAPYQRGYLARGDMAFDSDPGTAKSIEKTFAAKEAASGGSGVGGGGCGCN